jgi:prephenate dehydrogenase
MPTTIGIIGLGQIGASIGLALKSQGAGQRVLGHTRNSAVGRTALAMGAIDANSGLKELLRDSDLVFLCIPLSGIRPMLEQIRTWLKGGAVLIDTAPIRKEVNQWVQELLPTGVHHIGLVPAPNPSMLGSIEWGVKAARADFFHRSIIMVVESPRSIGAVEDLALNVVRQLGARPLLADPSESDGIMTTAHLLPQLASSALIEACLGTAGWQEARKLAGRPFATVTGGMAYFDDPASVEAAAIGNSARVVHGLDVLIAALKGMRDDIERQDGKQLAERLRHSYKAREHWLDERNEAEWLAEGDQSVEMPGAGEHITQMFFGGRMAERTRASSQKRPPKK